MNPKEFSPSELFSPEYRDLTLPRGIFYWLDRAKKGAQINATIGSARARACDFLPTDSTKQITCYLPTFHEILRSTPSESIYPYAPIAGLPNFRKKWKQWILKKISATRTLAEELLTEPFVVPGVTSGLYLLAKLFLAPGEKVICAHQRWENYDLIFEGNLHLEIVSFPLFEWDRLNIAGFRDALVLCAKEQRTAVAVLNFPNNPTGYMPGVEERKELREAMLEIAEDGRKVILIFDDAYDGFVYDPQVPRYSPFSDFVNLHKNIYPFKMDGLSKEFLIYGGRIGCITAGLHEPSGQNNGWAQELNDKIRALIRGTFSNSPHILQEATARALEDAAPALEREREIVRDILYRRWSQLVQLLGEFPYYRVDPFNSGFFCLVNIIGVDAAKLADYLLEEFKIGTVPAQIPEAGINALRVAFCSVMDEDIPRLVSDLKSALTKLSSGI